MNFLFCNFGEGFVSVGLDQNHVKASSTASVVVIHGNNTLEKPSVRSMYDNNAA